MIHPLADVHTLKVGTSTKIWQYCIILEQAQIGSNCNICAFCFIENEVIIGNNVTIKSYVSIWDGITIEDDVFIGSNVAFLNDLYPRSKQYKKQFFKTIIKQGATIGAGSVIICNITVGKHCMIGVGSVVTKNIPDYTLWYGNPAIQKGYVTKSGEVVSMDLIDKNGNKYILNNFEPVRV